MERQSPGTLIRLKPKGGLCNRMRAVDSAIALAHDLEAPLDIYWVRSGDLNCRFDLLFKGIASPSVRIHERRFRPLVFARTHRHVRAASKLWPFGALTFSKDENRRLESFDFRSMHPKRRVLIESYSRFYANPSPYACFTPTDELRQRVRDRASQFDSHTIGVHVRRADNTKSIAFSPDAVFIEQMRREISVQPSTRFYLATDAMEVKKTLRDLFGERILTTPYEASRRTVEGVQEALVELYVLASTAKILGSYWSTYSTTAAALGKIELVILRAADPAPAAANGRAAASGAGR